MEQEIFTIYVKILATKEKKPIQVSTNRTVEYLKE